MNVGLPLFADAVRSPRPAGGPAGLADPGRRRPAADRRAHDGCSAITRRGSTRPTPRCSDGSTPGVPLLDDGGHCRRRPARPRPAHPAALRAGDRVARRVRPAAALDAGRDRRRRLGRGRGGGRHAAADRPGPARAGQPARDGRPDGDRARPVDARPGRGQPRRAAPGRSRRSTRARATWPGSAARPTRRSSGCGSCATSPDRCSRRPWRRPGPIDVLSLAAQGLAMGDDVHMRTQASTNLLIRHLLPQLVAANGPAAVEFARFLSGQPPVLPQPGDGGREVA